MKKYFTFILAFLFSNTCIAAEVAQLNIEDLRHIYSPEKCIWEHCYKKEHLCFLSPDGKIKCEVSPKPLRSDQLEEMILNQNELESGLKVLDAMAVRVIVHNSGGIRPVVHTISIVLFKDKKTLENSFERMINGTQKQIPGFTVGEDSGINEDKTLFFRRANAIISISAELFGKYISVKLSFPRKIDDSLKMILFRKNQKQ